ncbi:hypothetical protein [Streptomyces sp. ODS28]|uniref:hypothetical protein n=1 Tax=Streptomyces sp. ODS28 TaxID=3136688 RepID=UPI0031F04C46
MSPRRKATTTARTERRETLLALLARAERGVLTPAEAARLRALVEAELDDADTARRSAGGQQAAVRRAQHRLDAAEEAIREIEADRDQLAREVLAERRRHRAEVDEARAARTEQQHAPCDH